MSVQGEIDRIQSGVDDIKAAITEMGGTVEEGAKVDQLGAAVRAIPAGGVSANDIYPVNSVKMWYDNEDHSTFLGFTWVRCLQNRFPAGIGGEAEFASIGQTGGEKTHALTTSEAPPIDSGNYLITAGTRERWINGYNGSAGQPHNNLPPYEVVSFWRRTA